MIYFSLHRILLGGIETDRRAEEKRKLLAVSLTRKDDGKEIRDYKSQISISSKDCGINSHAYYNKQ